MCSGSPESQHCPVLHQNQCKQQVKVDDSYFSRALLRPLWECCASPGVPTIRTLDLLEQVQRRVMKMISGLEHLSCEEQAERVGAFHHGEGKALVNS